MDELITVELTLNEGRVLLSCVLSALEGKVASLQHPAFAEAANSAAARLSNRISACATDPAKCAVPPKGSKP